jgi:hypothetical protein
MSGRVAVMDVLVKLKLSDLGNALEWLYKAEK